MKKRILFLLFIFFLTGCAIQNNNEAVLNSTTNNVDIIKPTYTSIPTEKPTLAPTETPTPISTPTPTITQVIDNEVDIIIGMLSFDDEITIEQYVEELKVDNPQGVYSVYDNTHYCETIGESERLSNLTYLLSEEGKNEIFIQLEQQYPGVYLKIEPNEQCTEIKFYADLEKYNESDFFVSLTPIFLSAFYSEFVHAYSLVPIEERYCIVKIIDNKTNEVIYNSEE